MLFWNLRAVDWTGGDSEQWEREIHGGVWLRKRQLLSFALMQVCNVVPGWLGPWSPRLAINLASCLSGSIGVMLAWRLVRWRSAPALRLALLVTGGFAGVWFGHIETYATSVTGLLAVALALDRALERGGPPWLPLAMAGVAGWCHLVTLFCLPAVAWALWIRRRDLSACSVALALLPLIALAIAVKRLGSGEVLGPHFVLGLWQPAEIWTGPQRFGFLSWDHAVLKGWFLWRAAGPGALLGSLLVLRGIRTTLGQCFGLLGAGSLLFLAVWHPDAGTLDWDLFCFPGVVALIGAAVFWPPRRWPVAWATATIGVNLLILGTTVLPAARLDSGRQALLELGSGNGQALLDDRLEIRGRMFVEPGGHTITTRSGRLPAVHLVLVAQPGASQRLDFGPGWATITPEQ